MKKTLYILLILLTSGIMSCKDFLEEENLSGITDENFYKDAAGFEALVNSSYASLRDIYNRYPALFEFGTDLTTRGEVEAVGGSVGNRVIEATALNEYKTLSADNSLVNSFFTNAYRGIQRCNTVINRANSIPGLSETIKNRRVAEARFLRTYYYYLLVENFGGVSIVQNEINTPITHFERSSEEEVYDFMIGDLLAAIPSLDPTTPEFGRVTKGAAKHLLSLLYLTKGYKSFAASTDFENAAKYAEEVIVSENHNLLSSFADVFKPGNEKNNEIIFSIQYDATSLTDRTVGNNQNLIFGWWISKEPGFIEGETAVYNKRMSYFMPTQHLYTLYNTSKDARYDATFLSQFYALKDDVKGGSVIKKGDLMYYFPKPDQPFTVADEAALKAANPNVEVIRFDQWKQNFDGVGGAMKFPMINKFSDPQAKVPASIIEVGASTKDVFIFRLAETYLIAAEAYFKMNRPDKAAEKLYDVRERAELPGQDLSVDAGDVTLDFILDERARELAGEYKRWLDLKRTRKLSRAFEFNILTKMANPGGVIDKYYLRPIPQTVRDRDTGGYPQNPDY